MLTNDSKNFLLEKKLTDKEKIELLQNRIKEYQKVQEENEKYWEENTKMTNYFIEKFQKSNEMLSNKNSSLEQLLKEKSQDLMNKTTECNNKEERIRELESELEEQFQTNDNAKSYNTDLILNNFYQLLEFQTNNSISLVENIFNLINNSVNSKDVHFNNLLRSLFKDLINKLKSMSLIEISEEVLTREYETDEIKQFYPQFETVDIITDMEEEGVNSEISINKQELSVIYENDDDISKQESNKNNDSIMDTQNIENIRREKEFLENENKKLHETLETYKNKVLKLQQENEKKKTEIQTKSKSLNHFKSLYCNNKFVIKKLKDVIETIEQERLEDKKLENEFKAYKQMYNSDRFAIMKHEYDDLLNENQQLHQKIEEISNKYWERNQETISMFNECEMLKNSIKAQSNTNTTNSILVFNQSVTSETINSNKNIIPVEENKESINIEKKEEITISNDNGEDKMEEDLNIGIATNDIMQDINNNEIIKKDKIFTNFIKNKDDNIDVNKENINPNQIENNSTAVNSSIQSKENDISVVSFDNKTVNSSLYNDSILKNQEISQLDFCQIIKRNDALGDSHESEEERIDNINIQEILDADDTSKFFYDNASSLKDIMTDEILLFQSDQEDITETLNEDTKFDIKKSMDTHLDSNQNNPPELSSDTLSNIKEGEKDTNKNKKLTIENECNNGNKNDSISMEEDVNIISMLSDVDNDCHQKQINTNENHITSNKIINETTTSNIINDNNIPNEIVHRQQYEVFENDYDIRGPSQHDHPHIHLIEKEYLTELEDFRAVQELKNYSEMEKEFMGGLITDLRNENDQLKEKVDILQQTLTQLKNQIHTSNFENIHFEEELEKLERKNENLNQLYQKYKDIGFNLHQEVQMLTNEWESTFKHNNNYMMEYKKRCDEKVNILLKNTYIYISQS
ncbi:hypothetical protein PIROE2DRAFT_3554 [Piromyces sp. E2]|nr:hypothetical protein PIROE2DRAFT_3554 [Piromyces sp. E2]|eukprot:OUM68707.1 hypothetical protein PIROE2DRAFT_3554 [Piromyces sp. E2]